MTLHRLLCLSAVAVAVGAWERAAWGDGNFYARSAGGFVITEPEPPVLVINFELFVFLQDGPITFEFLFLRLEQTPQMPGPDAVEGTFLYLGTEPTDTLSGTCTGIGIDNADGTWTGAGTWTALEGTGAFAGVTGSGTYTTAMLMEDQSAAAAFEGLIVPAPAPAGLLALGVLARGRRRSSVDR